MYSWNQQPPTPHIFNSICTMGLKVPEQTCCIPVTSHSLFVLSCDFHDGSPNVIKNSISIFQTQILLTVILLFIVVYLCKDM